MGLGVHVRLLPHAALARTTLRLLPGLTVPPAPALASPSGINRAAAAGLTTKPSGVALTLVEAVAQLQAADQAPQAPGLRSLLRPDFLGFNNDDGFTGTCTPGAERSRLPPGAASA